MGKPIEASAELAYPSEKPLECKKATDWRKLAPPWPHCLSLLSYQGIVMAFSIWLFTSVSVASCHSTQKEKTEQKARFIFRSGYTVKECY